MPQRLFQDLVSSRAGRQVRGGARALPFSLAFHAVAVAAILVLPQLAVDLPPVAAAPPTPIPSFHPVRIVEVRPTVPRVPEAARQRSLAAPAQQQVAAAGGGPALSSDLSQLGQGEITDDSRALCFLNCSGDGSGSGDGVILPTVAAGDGSGGGEPFIRRAGRDVTPPAKLAGNSPVYPDLARRARIEGEVVIECTIDPSGRVVNVALTRSNPLFDASALEAVRSWRYRPTLVDGVPVPVLMTVTVRFHLR